MKMLFAVLLGGVLFVQSVLAQDLRRDAPRRPESKANKSESPRDRLSGRFNAASPKLGELLPGLFSIQRRDDFPFGRKPLFNLHHG